MIAHRGLSGIERENTCAAFVAAGNRSYYGVETDVHVTKDGKFVVIHDDTTRRITLGQTDLNVEENGYSDVKHLILPDLDGTTVRSDIRIPLLEEYIKICKKYEKICVLEIKNHLEQPAIETLVAQIKELEYTESVVFIAFDLENCVNLRTLLPNNAIQLLTTQEVTNELIKTLCQYKFDLDIYYKQLTAEAVTRLHENGILVNCWTCDDPAEAEVLVSYGVDFITSNILE